MGAIDWFKQYLLDWSKYTDYLKTSHNTDDNTGQYRNEHNTVHHKTDRQDRTTHGTGNINMKHVPNSAKQG